MNAFVKNIQSLFSGPDTSAQDAEVQKQREQQDVAQTRQTQTAQTSEGEQSRQQGLASRQPRGRRLLLAATGESGVQSTLG